MSAQQEPTESKHAATSTYHKQTSNTIMPAIKITNEQKLEQAICSDKIDDFNMLLPFIPDINAPLNKYGETALYIAASLEFEDFCKVLFEHGACPQKKTSLGLSVFRRVALSNNKDFQAFFIACVDYYKPTKRRDAIPPR